MRTLAIACLFIVACNSKGSRSSDNRLRELERRLHEDVGESLKAVAAEYRELTGEKPDALRKIAAAHRRATERVEEFGVLRTLIIRDAATTDDRLRAVELLTLTERVIDDKTYQTGLGWLNAAAEREPWCATFDQLVRWTQGHPEQEATIDRALAGCPRDYEQAKWHALRVPTLGADAACDAVVHGELTLAQRCIDNGQSGWKVEVAKAVVGDKPLERLQAVSAAPNVTAFVLLLLAKAPGVSRDLACASLARAESIEVGWLPRAGGQSGIDGRYSALRKEAACP